MKNIYKEFIKKIRDKDPVLAEKVEAAICHETLRKVVVVFKGNKNIDPEVVDAIKAYTARGGNLASKFLWNMAKKKKLLNWVAKQTNKKDILYRGLSFSEAKWNKIYEEWINPGVKHIISELESFSRDPRRVFGYGSGGDICVRISLTGKNYADISKYSIYPEEKEVLFKAGTKYIIKSAEFKRPGALYVEAKEI